MDRRQRRFIPSPEGLEGRALLSVFGSQAPKNPASTVSPTIQQRSQRIERLPFFLQGFESRRSLPDDVVARLQRDLREIEGRLHNAAEPAVQDFNLELRRVGANASLSPADALALNRAFGRVLESAGATPRAVAALQADLNDLTHADANDVRPVILATNDYALILQTALGIGRPIRRPAAPRLAPGDDTGPKGDRTTSVRQPQLIGSYDPGAVIQILDEAGTVIGSGAVGTNGRYSVPITTTLADGTHALRVRATASDHFSEPSAPLNLIVNIRTPRTSTRDAVPGGPLALTPPRG
ncbi:MAG TPA: Ig-like domain-containing protein [Isosphaeraceae bacterium]